ncbi:MAG: UvrD-helicase domain-containing protein [Candidatus Riflebacteria bacterium]|nr:UvrD-helicase domain-containing protein [Candidatus Riflebacteria bacterium]
MIASAPRSSVVQAVATLNPRQREAVEILSGPLLIVAGAGSGKTKTLTIRVAHLIEQGASANSILGVTFTNKAAREMRERVEMLMPGVGSAITLTTFHSFCAMTLRRWCNHLGYPHEFTIYDADDQERLMKQVIAELDIDGKKFSPSFLLNCISIAKNDLISPTDYQPPGKEKELIKSVYETYQKNIFAAGAMDFDDLLFMTWRLLSENLDLLENMQRRYKHFFVDEYQDTNFAQYKLISLLSRQSGNLCVVGDEDQSIYGWRGASIRNIIEFEKDFPGARVVVLDQNYRSTQRILDAASSVIAKNSGPRKKQLWSEMKGGAPITFIYADDDRGEADRVSNEIERLHVDEQLPLGSMAVLFRMNSQSRAIEQALVRKQIPYEMTGGTKFFGRKEVKDVLAYLRVLVNPRDHISLRRIINVPTRGIGDTTVSRLTEEGPLWEALASRATGQKPGKLAPFYRLMLDLRELAGEGGIFAVAQSVIDRTEYLHFLRQTDEEKAEERISNVDSLLSDMRLQEETNPEITLAGYLEQAALHAEADDLDERVERVHLLTMHNAKGLEFPNVFIMGLEEGVFPHHSSKDEPEKLEEERRLAYVGMTRAMKRLYLSAARRRMIFGQWGFNPISRFIHEVPRDLFDREKPPMPLSNNFNRTAPSCGDSSSPRSLQGFNGNAVAFSAKSTESLKEKPYAGLFSGPSRQSVTAEVVQNGIQGTMANIHVGVKVFHVIFGPGRVIAVDGASLADFRVHIEFSKVGKKTLLLQYAQLRVINI